MTVRARGLERDASGWQREYQLTAPSGWSGRLEHQLSSLRAARGQGRG